MATPSRVGIIRISVDGEWDITDLLHLAESLSETYGLFYPLVAQDENVRDRLQDLLRKQFWSGDIDTRHFGRVVYRSIPDEEALKLKSFHYSSPGAFELGGVLVCLLLLARVARAWIKTSDEFLTLWEKVEKFFEKRRHLRKPKRQFALDQDMVVNSDEARLLVFEVGGKLGFDALSCDRLIEITGNPIAALKYLVAAGNEGRRLATLQQHDLLQLPAPSTDAIVLSGGSKRTRRRPDGVEVIVKKSRKPKDA